MASPRFLVYIAGPYTNPDPVDNTRKVIEVANVLLDSGIVVPYVPHLTLFWHFHTPRPIGDWYQYDLDILARCEGLLRLAGESTGADAEVAFAEANHIPVWHHIDAMLATLNPESVARAIGDAS